jgi:hypothetical protein
VGFAQEARSINALQSVYMISWPPADKEVIVGSAFIHLMFIGMPLLALLIPQRAMREPSSTR